MRKFIPIFFLILFFASCSGKDKVPKGILSHEKMQAILWDLIRADEFLTSYVLAKDSLLDRKQESALWYEQIFRFHQCSKEEFKKSFSFYQSHPSVFKVVLDSLQAKENALIAEQNKPHKVDKNLLQKGKTIQPQ